MAAKRARKQEREHSYTELANNPFTRVLTPGESPEVVLDGNHLIKLRAYVWTKSRKKIAHVPNLGSRPIESSSLGPRDDKEAQSVSPDEELARVPETLGYEAYLGLVSAPTHGSSQPGDEGGQILWVIGRFHPNQLAPKLWCCTTYCGGV